MACGYWSCVEEIRFSNWYVLMDDKVVYQHLLSFRDRSVIQELKSLNIISPGLLPPILWSSGMVI